MTTFERVSSRALAAILGFIFPDSCLACGGQLDAPEKHLCALCLRAIATRSRAFLVAPDSALCEVEAGPLVVWHVADFEGPARELIRALKYDGRTSIAGDLAALVAPHVRVAVPSGIDAVVPVPLHRTRRRERGFNQAELIALSLARLLDLPVIPGALVRARSTRSQARLGRREREVNVRGAFLGVRALTRGRRLLLLDDVVTTGATMRAARDALAEADASSVACLAVAARRVRVPERTGSSSGGEGAHRSGAGRRSRSPSLPAGRGVPEEHTGSGKSG